MNKRGERPESLLAGGNREPKRSVDLLEQENINRFDNAPRANKKRRKGGGNRHDSKRGNGNEKHDNGKKNQNKGE